MSLLYAYITIILVQHIFETRIFVITIQKSSSELPILSASLVQYIQNPTAHVPSYSPRNSSLRDIPAVLIYRFYQLVYAYISRLLTEPLFKTVGFVINSQEVTSKPPVSSCIFIYLLQTLSLHFRLREVIPVISDYAHIPKFPVCTLLLRCAERFCYSFTIST